MSKNKWLVLLGMLALTFVMAGCSDDDDPAAPTGDGSPDYGNNYQAPTVPQGMQQSQDPQAAMANAYVNMFAQMSAGMGFMEPPAGAKSAQDDGPPWTYTWSYTGDGMDITYTLVIDEDMMGDVAIWTWNVYFDGTIEGEVFDNYNMYSAWEAQDGSEGGFEFYDYPSQDVLFSWYWSYNADGSFDYEMIGYDSGVPQMQILLSVNLDGSGFLEFDEWNGTAWVIDFYVEWDALGNGSWIQYTDGVQTSSGNWTVVKQAAGF